jgi:hypothetical protein
MICDYCGGQCKMGTPQTLSASCLADLDADKRRIDWLDEYSEHLKDVFGYLVRGDYETLRATIDALMAEERGPTTAREKP